ncbi:hypothetical protein UFOVP424_30 [uncultured Caudovirales phage]|uniref:Uncharacterized protein n=1 Tax=uncultured Caudovirales phage TaxID=2100421 RepID=A0A6J5M6H8_9CAUD|nr:hypothetical protein UFOVP424_30 [uncultured Caudovirales phage]
MANKKYDFNFNLSSLSTYTDEVGGELIRRAILESETIKLIKVQPGVKGSQAINLLNSNLEVQDGTCGWSPSGSTIYTQRDITVCQYKINETLCPADLNNYWLGQLLTPGSTPETVPFEQQISELKTAQISQYVENQIWGASSGTTCFSGLKELVRQSGSTQSTVTGGIVVTGQSAISSTTALAQVDSLIEQIPDDVVNRTDWVVFMSHANYRKYLINYRTANYYHFNPEGSYEEFKTFHPATNILVHPVGGLLNSNLVVLMPAGYAVAGVDLMSDMDNLKMFYSVDFDEVRLRANFKIGVQLAWPNFVITNGLT